MAKPIDAFQGRYRFLSNFYPAIVMLDGIQYPTVEHAYQAAKTLNPRQREGIRLARTPGDAKRLGRKAEKREDWEGIKRDIMTGLEFQKFDPFEMSSILINTYPAELIEGNTWHDNYWGNCICPKCANIPGENWLGRILMNVRDHLMRDERG